MKNMKSSAPDPSSVAVTEGCVKGLYLDLLLYETELMSTHGKIENGNSRRDHCEPNTVQLRL